MSEEEVLAQLRDIHVPANLEAAPIVLAAWPFIVLAIIVGVVLLARWWKRNRWRRIATGDLARIAGAKDPATQWSLLLAFAGTLSQRAGRSVNLPALAYRRPASITDAERAEFISFLSGELRR